MTAGLKLIRFEIVTKIRASAPETRVTLDSSLFYFKLCFLIGLPWIEVSNVSIVVSRSTFYQELVLLEETGERRGFSRPSQPS